MGGFVFKESNVQSIKRENIQPTINQFIKEFIDIFPNTNNWFNPLVTLGSVGKKDISGDIDLGIDEKYLDNVLYYDLDKDEVNSLFEKFKKRARTATDYQLTKRAIIVSIANRINNSSSSINVDIKGSGAGALYCEFPQYDIQNNQLGYNVQIDLNFGNIEWLKFAYFSDSYTGNIKGLHRTQLMLHMFAYKGYVFSHNYGVKNRETQEIVANNPQQAIELLNKLYDIDITENILLNYNTLQEYLHNHLSIEELNGIYDIYIKTLDSTRCDIPEDLQEYWIENQNRLGLKGKFLPENSKLISYQTEKE